MKENKYFLNTALAGVLGLWLLAEVLVRAFLPNHFLPQMLNIPGMVLLSLIALLLDHYIAKNAPRCYICIPVCAVLAFGLLPFAACIVSLQEAAKLAVVGGAVFTVTTFLFSSVQERLASGPAAKAAPVLSAFGLFLASQCLTGMIL